MRADGFTQVELILTLGLLALFGAVGFESMRYAIQKAARQSMDERRRHELEPVFSLVARDIRSACLASDDPTAVFVGRKESSSSRLDFQRALPGDDQVAEEIGYHLRRDPVSGQTALTRRSETPANEDGLDGGREAFLCDASSLSFRYFDGEGWHDTWGWDASQARPTTGIRGLPLMVAIRISSEERVIPVMVPLLNRSRGA